MNFIKNAYLPQSRVDYLIAGNGIKPFEIELSNLNVNILKTEQNEFISKPVSSHADLVVNHLGNNNFLLEKGQTSLKFQLEKSGAKCQIIEERVSGDYPTDCLLNCIVTKSNIICNEKCVSKQIVEYAMRNQLQIINVNQGYSKCSICPVYENAYITDDIGIYNCLKAYNNDVLLVKKGSVKLNGYNYGFIGGCCGKLSNDIIAFCGDVKKHSDYNEIKSFTANYNINLLSLSNNDLIDIGSLIPISEIEVDYEK